MMKKPHISKSFTLFLVLAIILSVQSLPVQAKRMQAINVGAPAVRQSTIYQEPEVSGTQMTDSEVVSHFEMLIYARDRMLRHLSSYKQLGWNGLALLYLDASKNNGPKGLSSVTAQKTLCTSAQKAVEVYTNTITMDTGEMCRIHDAIINKTTVDGYKATESWFLHRSDGSRYEASGGGAAQYRMNFANAEYQKYYANKLMREFQSVDPNHLPSGAQGVFFDNVNISWNDLLNLNGGNPPAEFLDKTAYQQGMASFLAKIRAAQPGIKIWGNMTSFSTNVDNFTSFKPSLDGAMIEGAFLDWDGDPRPADDLETGNAVADAWGKPLLYVVQGNSAGTYHNYAFGLYLLMTNADAYFFFTDQSSYAHYYEIAQYGLGLGNPVGARQQVTTGVWKRQFEHGVVQVDMNAQTVTYTMDPVEQLINRGFNTYTGTSLVPDSWVAAQFGSKDGKDTGIFQEGSASVKIKGAASTTKIMKQVLSLSGNSGDAFVFSLWLKGASVPSTGLCRAQVQLFNGTNLVMSKTVNCPTGTYDFQQKKISFNAAGKYNKVIVKLAYSKSGGTVWFDGLSLVK